MNGVIAALEALDDLKRQGVVRDFVLFGSVAAFAYLEPRETKDLDIAVLVDSDAEYIEVLQALSALAGQQVSHQVTLGGFRVEVFPVDVNEMCREGLADARTVELGGRQIKVLAPERLIYLALEAWRPIDRARIEELLPHADRGALDSLLVRLDGSGELRERLRRLLDLPKGQPDPSNEHQARLIESKRALHAERAALRFDEKLHDLAAIRSSHDELRRTLRADTAS
jgi:predicted nucleotidyltransferase